MNEVCDCFRLRQINAAIEKGALGKFAWLGQTRSTFEHRVKDEFCRQQTAMARNLDHVLACEGPWSAQDGQQHFINDTFLADDLAVMNGVSQRRAGLQGRLAHRSERSVRDG